MSQRPIPAGTTVNVRAHASAPGKGLSYPSMVATLSEPCETEGWDVIDCRDADGNDLSVYSFDVESIATGDTRPTFDNGAKPCVFRNSLTAKQTHKVDLVDVARALGVHVNDRTPLPVVREAVRNALAHLAGKGSISPLPSL